MQAETLLISAMPRRKLSETIKEWAAQPSRLSLAIVGNRLCGKTMSTRKGSLTALFLLACTCCLAQTPIRTTFVSGSGGNSKEGAANVCDGKLSTKWCIDERRQMPYTVVLDAGEKTAVTAYGLVTGDDTFYYPGRNPLEWRVTGSDDKQSWTPVDVQKYNRTMRDENEQEYRFKVETPAAFRFYRFEFLRMMDGTRLQLSEIKLYK